MRDMLYWKFIRKWFAKQIDAEVFRRAMYVDVLIAESNVRKAPDSPNFPPATWHPSKVIIPEPGDQPKKSEEA